MDQPTEQFVLDIIDHAKDLTLATVRADGYPQATTVSYAHDGMELYVCIGRDSQKADNIRHNNKVSLTINKDYHDWREIKGLSIGGLAEVVHDPQQRRHVADCLLRRFPEAEQWASAPEAEDVEFLKIRPQVISILDYEKGFGHTDLVRI